MAEFISQTVTVGAEFVTLVKLRKQGKSRGVQQENAEDHELGYRVLYMKMDREGNIGTKEKFLLNQK